METFQFTPQINVERANEPKINLIQFGGGYEMRQPQGIHHNLRTFEVVFKGRESQIIPINDFLNRHAGYKAFLWTPYRDKIGKFKCAKWKTTLSTDYFTLTATFEEVVA